MSCAATNLILLFCVCVVVTGRRFGSAVAESLRSAWVFGGLPSLGRRVDGSRVGRDVSCGMIWVISRGFYMKD